MKIPPVAASILTLTTSIVVGFAGVSVTDHLFDGTGAIVFLLWAYLTFHIVKFIMKSRDQFAPIPNLAFVFSALGTMVFAEVIMMWPGLVLSGIAVYRRIRNKDRRAAGLTWSAALIATLSFAYWLYLTLLFMSI
jgi:hypothetical protein